MLTYPCIEKLQQLNILIVTYSAQAQVRGNPIYHRLEQIPPHLVLQL